MKQKLKLILKYVLILGIAFFGAYLIERRNFIKKYGMSRKMLRETLGGRVYSAYKKSMLEYLFATKPSNMNAIIEPDSTALAWSHAISGQTGNEESLGDYRVQLKNRGYNPWDDSDYVKYANLSIDDVFKREGLLQLKKGNWQKIIKTYSDELGIDYKEDLNVINNAISDFAKKNIV